MDSSDYEDEDGGNEDEDGGDEDEDGGDEDEDGGDEDEEEDDEDDDEAGLHLSWLLVGVWHEAAHKVGLAVVKSRLRKDARARIRHEQVFGRSSKY